MEFRDTFQRLSDENNAFLDMSSKYHISSMNTY